MATFLDRGPTLRLSYDATDDIQIVHMTRAQARAYFDNGHLPEAFDTGLDLAQAEASTTDAIVVIVIAKEEAS